MTHPFTPTYIEMAKAAEEIQAMRIHSPPDRPRFSNYELGDAIILSCSEKDEVEFLGDIAFNQDDAQMELDEWSGEPVYPAVWLPRLDQLLGMLQYPVPLRLVNFLAQETSHGATYWNEFWDWHELALAVVMREKWGKVWNGKGWVKG